MKPITRRALIVALLLCGASASATYLTPVRQVVDGQAALDLETLIPKQFGEWQADERQAQAVVNPQTKEFLSTIYSQTLSRTYVNAEGRHIMLSLAYGADQSHDTQIHKPEVCYPAQGFQIISKNMENLDYNGQTSLPVMRVDTTLGQRHEPVTYWIRVGDTVARGAIEQNLARINYGLKGHIPDGILFRVSEITRDSQASYALQDRFIRELLSSLNPNSRKVLIGNLAAGQ